MKLFAVKVKHSVTLNTDASRTTLLLWQVYGVGVPKDSSHFVTLFS